MPHTDPRRKLWQDAKRRAKVKRLPFSLKVEDIKIPARCPVFHIRLFRNTGGKNQHDNSPTLDRLIPRKGYVKGNVIVVSSKANMTRGCATPEELETVAQFYRRLFAKSSTRGR